MTTSTDREPGLCREAWHLDTIDDRDLANLLAIPRAEAGAQRQALLRRWASPAGIEELLGTLPVPTLALLGLLAESGGVLAQPVLAERAAARFKMSRDDVQIAANAALREALVVPLSSGWGDPVLAMVAPAADRLAPLVLDLDLPDLPAGALIATPNHEPRMLLAAVTMLGHADIKCTVDRRPNRGQLKRLAGLAGLDLEQLERLLITAIDVGLISLTAAEYLRPLPEMLEHAAAGRYPGGPAAAMIARLVEDGPAPLERAHRLVQRMGPIGPDSLGLLPGLAIGVVGGVPAIGRADLDGAPAGHIMPSFEVFVPPESPAIDLIRIGRFAEVTRLDRVITMRVTRAAVCRAATAGLRAEDMIATLAALGRHPVPQNVEVAIRDWAGQSQHAIIDFGRVVVVEPGTGDRVEAALSALAPRRVAPDVFVLPAKTQPRLIAQALARAGVQVRDSDVRPAPSSGSPAPLPPRVTTSPQLRSRFAAWQRGQPAHSSDQAHEQRRQLTAEARRVENELDRWAERTGQRWPATDHMREGMCLALAILGPEQTARLLVAPDVGRLATTTLKALEQLPSSTKLPLSIQTWRKLLTVSGGAPPSPTPPQGEAPLLPPHRTHQALVRARDQGEPITLGLRSGRRTTLRVRELVQRGSAWLLLGEELETEVAVALRYEEIAGVCAATAPRARWSPAPGELAPQGHTPCPCGSGERYRRCCRAPA